MTCSQTEEMVPFHITRPEDIIYYKKVYGICKKFTKLTRQFIRKSEEYTDQSKNKMRDFTVLIVTEIMQTILNPLSFFKFFFQM